MHRPTLTLRRFGAMSFGLGYFEDGIWVDHSIPDASSTSGAADGDAWPADGVALDAVHRWYGCCADPAAAQPSVSWEHGMSGEPRRHAAVSARSERPDASTVVAMFPVSSVRAVEK